MMKLTNQSHKIRNRKSGMTLLELTIVILVLLSLISIFFIAARGWMTGSDRAASILQIRTVQQAVRGYSNMHGKGPGDEMSKADIFGGGKFMERDPSLEPHPAGAGYSFNFPDESVVPDFGDLYMIVSGPEKEIYEPTSGSYTDW